MQPFAVTVRFNTPMTDFRNIHSNPVRPKQLTVRIRGPELGRSCQGTALPLDRQCRSYRGYGTPANLDLEDPSLRRMTSPYLIFWCSAYSTSRLRLYQLALSLHCRVPSQLYQSCKSRVGKQYQPSLTKQNRFSTCISTRAVLDSRYNERP